MRGSEVRLVYRNVEVDWMGYVGNRDFGYIFDVAKYILK